MAMANAMMAMRGQAEAWIASTNQALTASGHGFTPEDQAAIAASHAAHPYPEGHSEEMRATPEEVAAAQDLAKRAMEVEYPPNGLDPADPRLASIEGVSLPLFAVGSKAIGWSTDDAHIDRVVTALGIPRDTWDRAGTTFRTMVADDVVLGAFYGQLYSMA